MRKIILFIFLLSAVCYSQTYYLFTQDTKDNKMYGYLMPDSIRIDLGVPETQLDKYDKLKLWDFLIQKEHLKLVAVVNVGRFEFPQSKDFIRLYYPKQLTWVNKYVRKYSNGKFEFK